MENQNIDLMQIREGVIYVFTINNNGKNMYYVGQTINPKKYGYKSRYYQHKTGSNRIEPQQYIDKILKEVGFDNAKYEEIFYIQDTLINVACMLNIYEQFYIQKYNSNNPLYGYNKTIGGQMNYINYIDADNVNTQELQMQPIQFYEHSQKVQFFNNNVFVKEFNSIKDACKELKISSTTIFKILYGNIAPKYPNYKFIYSDEISHNKQMQVKSTHKKVYQYDYSGKLIKIWNSVSDCVRSGYHATRLYECFKRKRFGYKNYIWRQYDENIPDIYLTQLNINELSYLKYLEDTNYIQTKANRKIARETYKKSSIQLYIDDKLIKEFEYLYECYDYFSTVLNNVLNKSQIYDRLITYQSKHKLHPEIVLRYKDLSDYDKIYNTYNRKNVNSKQVCLIYENKKYNFNSISETIRYLRNNLNIKISKETVKRLLQGKSSKVHSNLKMYFKNENE